MVFGTENDPLTTAESMARNDITLVCTKLFAPRQGACLIAPSTLWHANLN